MMEGFEEFLRDIITTGVRFETEIELKRRHVIGLTLSTSFAPVHRIVIDTSPVPFDAKSRQALQVEEVIQTLFGITVRDEPQCSILATKELIVEPLIVFEIGQGPRSLAEQTVGGQRHFTVGFVTDRPIELIRLKKSVIDDGRRFVGPENPDGVGFAVRSLWNRTLMILNVVGVDDHGIGFA